MKVFGTGVRSLCAYRVRKTLSGIFFENNF
jgi:hypothetical protein